MGDSRAGMFRNAWPSSHNGVARASNNNPEPEPKTCTQSELDKAIAARDKEWVTWLDSKCPHDSLGINNFTRRECDFCWQQLKKELEVKE